MNKGVAVVVAVWLSSGCTARGAKIAVVGAGMSIVGASLFVGADTHDLFVEEPPPPGSTWVAVRDAGIALLVVGSLLELAGIAVGIDGYVEARRPPPAVPDPAIAAPARSRDEAWQLTKAAALAGRADDCATVALINPQVQGLDSEFHDTVFLRDVAIARCLSQRELK